MVPKLISNQPMNERMRRNISGNEKDSFLPVSVIFSSNYHKERHNPIEVNNKNSKAHKYL